MNPIISIDCLGNETVIYNNDIIKNAISIDESINVSKDEIYSKKSKNKGVKSNKKTIDENKKLKNKGTGAGGKMTTKNGLSFENITNNENNLINDGYIKNVMNRTKYGYYFSKKDKVEILYFIQNGFKLYMKKTYDMDMIRRPDEVYIVKNDNKTIVKILEKKYNLLMGQLKPNYGELIC